MDDVALHLNWLFAGQTAGASAIQRESVLKWQKPDDRFYRDVQRAAAGEFGASQEAQDVVDDLDSLMAQLPEQVEAWRGARSASRTFGLASDQLESLLNVDKQVDRFFATSLNRQVVENEFIAPGPDPVMYRITAQVGAYALWVAALGDPRASYQQELLFPPGTSVRIVDVDRTYRVPIIRAEVT